MKNVVMAAAISVTLCGIAAAGPLPPQSKVTIKVPADTFFAFKPGAGVEPTRTYCLTCHSSAYVSTQPALTKAQWTGEVTKMKAVYGAPMPDDQVAPIADYLANTYGKP